VKDLFQWVECAKYAEKDEPKIPFKFSLNTSFPTKTLDRNASKETLKEAGLVPNAAIILQAQEEEDEF